jgi:hypothetical protein
MPAPMQMNNEQSIKIRLSRWNPSIRTSTLQNNPYDLQTEFDSFPFRISPLSSYPLITLISSKYHLVLRNITLPNKSSKRSVHARSHTPFIINLPCSSAAPYVPGSSSLRSIRPLHIGGIPSRVSKDSIANVVYASKVPMPASNTR